VLTQKGQSECRAAAVRAGRSPRGSGGGGPGLLLSATAIRAVWLCRREPVGGTVLDWLRYVAMRYSDCLRSGEAAAGRGSLLGGSATQAALAISARSKGLLCLVSYSEQQNSLPRIPSEPPWL